MKNASQSYHSDHVDSRKSCPAFEGSPLIDPKLITEQGKVNDIHLTSGVTSVENHNRSSVGIG